MAKKQKKSRSSRESARQSTPSILRRFEIAQVRLVRSESKLEITKNKLPRHSQIKVAVECFPRKESRDALVDVRCVVNTRYEPKDDPSIVIGCIFQAVYHLKGKVFPRFGDAGKAELSRVGLLQCWPYVRQFVHATSVQMGLPGLTLPIAFIDPSTNQIGTVAGVPIQLSESADST